MLISAETFAAGEVEDAMEQLEKEKAQEESDYPVVSKKKVIHHFFFPFILSYQQPIYSSFPLLSFSSLFLLFLSCSFILRKYETIQKRLFGFLEEIDR